jgi:hypothetical protein
VVEAQVGTVLLGVAVFSSIILSQGSLASSENPKSTTIIRIKVFNQAPAPSDRVIAAEKQTSLIFQLAGIGTDWLDCSVDAAGRPRAPECEEVWRPTDLKLLIVDRPNAHLSQSAMGSAKPDPETGYATVFYQRIRKEAKERAMRESEIMSLVMAHELGHLLLRSGSHSTTGVMNARLGRTEWERADHNRLRFSGQQASAMREEVAQLIRAHANAPLLARRMAPPATVKDVE